MTKGKVTKIKWLSSKREDWLRQRNELQGVGSYDRVMFGSSDVSTILGVNKWSSRRKLYWNLLGRYITSFNSFKLEMGLRYENVNAEAFQCFTPDRDGFDDRFVLKQPIRKLQTPRYFVTNSGYPHSFSSLDRVLPKGQPCPFTGELVGTPRSVELKFVNYNAYSAWGGVLPEYYRSQLAHQTMMLNSDAGYLSVIAGGDWYDVGFYEKDVEYEKYIDHELTEFHLMVLKAKATLRLIDEELKEATPDLAYIETLEGMLSSFEPEPTAADLEFVDNEMFPESNDLEFDGGEKGRELVDAYTTAHEAENEAKEAKKITRVEITKYMEDFEVMKTDEYKVINRRTKDGKSYFSVKRISSKLS